MGILFTRFSQMLTPLERERLAELNKSGLPRYVRDDVNRAGTEYWKNFELGEPYRGTHLSW